MVYVKVMYSWDSDLPREWPITLNYNLPHKTQRMRITDWFGYPNGYPYVEQQVVTFAHASSLLGVHGVDGKS